MYCATLECADGLALRLIQLTADTHVRLGVPGPAPINPVKGPIMVEVFAVAPATRLTPTLCPATPEHVLFRELWHEVVKDNAPRLYHHVRGYALDLGLDTGPEEVRALVERWASKDRATRPRRSQRVRVPPRRYQP